MEFHGIYSGNFMGLIADFYSIFSVIFIELTAVIARDLQRDM
jgi:hypothetical protein